MKILNKTPFFDLLKNISGLDNLVNLELLELRYNQISEIQEFSNLKKLEWLYISSNRLRDSYLERFGKLNSVGYAFKP